MWILFLLLAIVIIYYLSLEGFCNNNRFTSPYSIYFNEDAQRRQQIWYQDHLDWLGGPCN